ncbi:MAG: DNA polymerase III subunit alpha, partial [Anaerolineae bacterium]|nr:DNA polymerase III subunit alpha [Anaerolineae bacterium]
MAGFIHLHTHTEYSLLDGLSSCQELAERAAELGMPALAITDHGVMLGAVQFYKACRKAGIKPIIGMEAYVAPRGRRDRDSKLDRRPYHLVLLAQNQQGYKNLMQLATLAQLEGFYYKPRIDRESLEKYSEGLIVLSGCASSEVARHIRDGQLDAARETIAWHRSLFPGRYFLEIQDHGIAELDQITAGTIELAREVDLPLVATNDIHYTRHEQASIHDVLLCIQTGKTLGEPNRMRMDGETYYMRRAEEMAALFPEVPEALENSLRIAEMCDVTLEFGTYHLPIFDVPEGFNSETYLRHLTEEGLQKKYSEITPKIRDRMNHELDTIHSMGFDTYFLIVWDLCRFSRENDIWWNVRGSGAGSIVAYGLDVTFLDPLQHGLIFERFLNVGRVSMPDIDLDYPDDQRAEMIRYTVEKYGVDNVAQIITFGTMGAKAAIRDVGRALDYPLNEVDQIARLVPAGPKVKLRKSLEEVTGLKEAYENQDHVRRLIDAALGVEGKLRHASTHAAGVIVSDIPLAEYVPLHRPTRSTHADEIGKVTQYNMTETEELGLLKVDFLGLATLTLMRRTCRSIKERHGLELGLRNIPTDHVSTYELLSSGECTGVFQVEGQGMRRMLMQMQPKIFDDIMAAISLYRPGPMEYIDDYIDRLHGVKPIEYRHDSLKPILEETMGIIVYQEQIIRILTDLAGYTAGEADLVRRAVGKKKAKELKKHRTIFIEGATSNGGLPREAAEGIFDDIEYFARYGFNKGHAADYAVLTCQTAYLKANYAVEYMTALLTVERHNTEKVGTLIAECRHLSIQVLPPDVNHSGLDFVIEGMDDGQVAIRYGMGAVKNVGEGPVETILQAREADGAFKSLEDFCHRVDLRQVNRRALESLIKVGALKQFGTRSELLSFMDQMMGTSASHHHAQAVGQMSLFGEATGVSIEDSGTLFCTPESIHEVDSREILGWEKDLIGVYISEHPLSETLVKFRDALTSSVETLDQEAHGQQVTIAGMVQRVRPIKTKKDADMAFVTLEGIQSTCDVVVFPKVWEKTKYMWPLEEIVVVNGKIDSGRRDEPSLLVNWVKSPDDITLPTAPAAPPLNSSEGQPSDTIRRNGRSRMAVTPESGQRPSAPDPDPPPAMSEAPGETAQPPSEMDAGNGGRHP